MNIKKIAIVALALCAASVAFAAPSDEIFTLGGTNAEERLSAEENSSSEELEQVDDSSETELELPVIKSSIPLIEAAKSGDAKEVRRLVLRHAQVDAHEENGITALMAAVIYSHERAIDELLEGGANVNAQSRAGWTPLMFAIFIGADDALLEKLIAQGANLNAANAVGWTPLMIAIRLGKPLQFIENLIELGAYAEHRAKDGTTPMMLACAYADDPEIIRTLYNNRAEIAIPNKRGDAPLHFVARNSSDAAAEIVRFLVKNRAPLWAKNRTGATPLMAAAERASRVDIIDALLEADWRVNTKNRDGMTALMLAAGNPTPAALEIARHLADAGANFATTDKWGRSAYLVSLSSAHSVEMVRWLKDAERGAAERNVNARLTVQPAAKIVSKTAEMQVFLPKPKEKPKSAKSAAVNISTGGSAQNDAERVERAAENISAEETAQNDTENLEEAGVSQPENPEEKSADEVVAEKSEETPTEELVAEKAEEISADEPVAEKSEETPTDELMTEKSVETPTDEPVAEKSGEISTDEPVAEKSEETSTDELVTEKSAETPTDEPVVEKPGENPENLNGTTEEKETPEAPEEISPDVKTEISEGTEVSESDEKAEKSGEKIEESEEKIGESEEGTNESEEKIDEAGEKTDEVEEGTDESEKEDGEEPQEEEEEEGEVPFVRTLGYQSKAREAQDEVENSGEKADKNPEIAPLANVSLASSHISSTSLRKIQIKKSEKMRPFKKRRALKKNRVARKKDPALVPQLLLAAVNPTDASPEIIAWLIERGEDLEARDTEGRTALLCAVRYNSNPSAARALLEEGASPHVAYKKSSLIQLLRYNDRMKNGDKVELAKIIRAARKK